MKRGACRIVEPASVHVRTLAGPRFVCIAIHGTVLTSHLRFCFPWSNQAKSCTRVGEPAGVLFCRIPDKTPPIIAAGGKRIVASLKERIIHGHGGKNDPTTCRSADGAA